LALAKLARGDDRAIRDRLIAQGGMVLMLDGVQHDKHSPALNFLWDALSGTPLFGERSAGRSEEDFVPLLQRVKAMGVPMIGVVTDKETGLLPAVAEVFPGVPHQFCKHHFLKNCAEPLKEDLAELRKSVRKRAKKVYNMQKRLSRQVSPRADTTLEPAASTELQEARASMGVPAVEAALSTREGVDVVDVVDCADAATRAKALEAGVSLQPGEAATPNPAWESLAEPTLSTQPPVLLGMPGMPTSSNAAAVGEAAVSTPAPVVEASKPAPAESEPAELPPAEEAAGLLEKLCKIVKQNSKASGKAPLEPQELIRYEKLELVRRGVEEIRAAKAALAANDKHDARTSGRRQATARARSARQGAQARLA
jgi:hypothetical protein